MTSTLNQIILKISLKFISTDVSTDCQKSRYNVLALQVNFQDVAIQDTTMMIGDAQVAFTKCNLNKVSITQEYIRQHIIGKKNQNTNAIGIALCLM